MARSMSGMRASASSYSDSAWLRSTSEMIPFSKRSWNSSRVRLAAVRRALGDLQLLVQRPDVHVGGRHRADQGQHHGAPGLLRAEQLGPRRLGRPAELAPEVDLPAGVEKRLVLVVGVVLAVEATKASFRSAAGEMRRHCRRPTGTDPRASKNTGRRTPRCGPWQCSRSLFSSRAVRTSPFSTGSLNCSHQAVLARSRTSFSSNRQAAGRVDGRTLVVRADRHAARQQRQEDPHRMQDSA